MGIFSTIFGGGSSTKQESSSSSNKAYDTLNQNFSPLFGQAQLGANSLQALLGGDATGFNQFKNATGFNSQLTDGLNGITGASAAGGLLRSGSTKKGLQSFGQNLQNQFAGSYMDRLLAQANLGFNAGNLVSGAGAQSQSSGTASSSESKGLGGVIGGIGSLFALSDIRTKENIVSLGTLPNGLGVYSFDYIDGAKDQIGVMAQEVSILMPEALGPKTDEGYMTVNYGKIKETL